MEEIVVKIRKEEEMAEGFVEAEKERVNKEVALEQAKVTKLVKEVEDEWNEKVKSLNVLEEGGVQERLHKLEGAEKERVEKEIEDGKKNLEKAVEEAWKRLKDFSFEG